MRFALVVVLASLVALLVGCDSKNVSVAGDVHVTTSDGGGGSALSTDADGGAPAAERSAAVVGKATTSTSARGYVVLAENKMEQAHSRSVPGSFVGWERAGVGGALLDRDGVRIQYCNESENIGPWTNEHQTGANGDLVVKSTRELWVGCPSGTIFKPLAGAAVATFSNGTSFLWLVRDEKKDLALAATDAILAKNLPGDPRDYSVFFQPDSGAWITYSAATPPAAEMVGRCAIWHRAPGSGSIDPVQPLSNCTIEHAYAEQSDLAAILWLGREAALYRRSLLWLRGPKDKIVYSLDDTLQTEQIPLSASIAAIEPKKHIWFTTTQQFTVEAGGGTGTDIRRLDPNSRDSTLLRIDPSFDFAFFRAPATNALWCGYPSGAAPTEWAFVLDGLAKDQAEDAFLSGDRTKSLGVRASEPIKGAGGNYWLASTDGGLVLYTPLGRPVGRTLLEKHSINGVFSSRHGVWLTVDDAREWYLLLPDESRIVNEDFPLRLPASTTSVEAVDENTFVLSSGDGARMVVPADSHVAVSASVCGKELVDGAEAFECADRPTLSGAIDIIAKGAFRGIQHGAGRSSSACLGRTELTVTTTQGKETIVHHLSDSQTGLFETDPFERGYIRRGSPVTAVLSYRDCNGSNVAVALPPFTVKPEPLALSRDPRFRAAVLATGAMALVLALAFFRDRRVAPFPAIATVVPLLVAIFGSEKFWSGISVDPQWLMLVFMGELIVFVLTASFGTPYVFELLSGVAVLDRLAAVLICVPKVRRRAFGRYLSRLEESLALTSRTIGEEAYVALPATVTAADRLSRVTTATPSAEIQRSVLDAHPSDVRVIGSGGIGKSALMRHAIGELIAALKSDASTPIPIWVRSSSAKKLTEVVIQALGPFPISESVLAAGLDRGAFVLFVDGVSESGWTVDKLVELASVHQQCPLVLASRPLGDGQRITPTRPFVQVDLQPLESGSDALMTFVESQKRPGADATAITRALARFAPSPAATFTPIFVKLIARHGADGAASIEEVYKHAVETLLIATDAASRAKVEGYAYALARDFYWKKKQRRISWSAGTAAEMQPLVAAGLVLEIDERRSRGGWRFMHDSIQTYLAAFQLSQDIASSGSDPAVIRAALIRSAGDPIFRRDSSRLLGFLAPEMFVFLSDVWSGSDGPISLHDTMTSMIAEWSNTYDGKLARQVLADRVHQSDVELSRALGALEGLSDGEFARMVMSKVQELPALRSTRVVTALFSEMAAVVWMDDKTRASLLGKLGIEER